MVGVGDSVEHDVAGARGAGVSAALLRSGIIAGTDGPGLEELYHRHGVVPNYILPAFVWRNSALRP